MTFKDPLRKSLPSGGVDIKWNGPTVLPGSTSFSYVGWLVENYVESFQRRLKCFVQAIEVIWDRISLRKNGKS